MKNLIYMMTISASDKLLYLYCKLQTGYTSLLYPDFRTQKCCESLWDVYTDGNTDDKETQQQHILPT